MNIGRHSYVASTGSDISAGVVIGNYTSIAPYVQMHSRTNHSCIEHPAFVANFQLRGYPKVTSRNDIVIGSDVWIGRNAVLLGGITIGHGAIIGAYAVVAKDIPPYAVAVGNPVRILRYRFDPETIEALLKIRWWDWSDEEIAARIEDFKDVRALTNVRPGRPKTPGHMNTQDPKSVSDDVNRSTEMAW